MILPGSELAAGQSKPRARRRAAMEAACGAHRGRRCINVINDIYDTDDITGINGINVYMNAHKCH